MLLISTLAGVHLHPPRLPQRSAPRPVQVMVVRKSPTREQSTPPARVEAEGISGDPDLRVGSFTFDVERIARRRNMLFPFVTDDVAFTDLEQRLSATGLEPLTNPYTRTSAPWLPPLGLDPARLQRIVDDTWSRRDRWRSFAANRDLIDRYDGDTGAERLGRFGYRFDTY